MLLDHGADSSTSASLFLLYAAVCLLVHKGKMSTVFSGQERPEPSPRTRDTTEHVAPAPEPRTQPDKPPRHHRRLPGPAPRPSLPLPSLSIFHPRRLDEIYAEQAYLSVALQAHTARLCDLLGTYHAAEADTHGPSRKIKRRARRQVGLLRAQIRQASEQQKTMHLRLSDLLLEAKSRAALDLARHHPGPATSRDGATAAGPDKPARDERADSGVGVFPDSDDELARAVAGAPFPDDDAACESRRGATGSLAWRLDALVLRRQTSMPDIRTSFLG
ncbi:hypothetical protein E4U53_004839 [Claviceps sorghi]|nr:hypothetical protein E4U53_004839 [Claviceps sorghi]